MNIPIVFCVLGWISIFEGALMLLPLLTAAIYGEVNCAFSFITSIGISLILGLSLICRRPKSKVMYLKEGFVITALGWIIMSIIGSLPFLFSGSINSAVDAVFETASGFTTTGASILNNVEILPKSILLWRSFTHWIGGMGVLVFLLMIKPLSGASNVNLMKAESPGPQVEKLVPKLRQTAQILYGIYFILTLLQIIFLLIGKMSVFDAVTTAFGTAGTGGFGIKNDSIAGYSVYIQIVTTVFMTLFGVNFSFYFLLTQRKVKRAFAIEELRWYFIIIISAALLIAFNTRGMFRSVSHALQQSFFQVCSIITTTGFSTADFDKWPGLSKTILVMLMFVGACAGSTGGGMKVSRFIIFFKNVRRELKYFLHPQTVSGIYIDKKRLSTDVIRLTNAYIAAYFIIFTASLFLISFDNFDAITNFTAVATTLNNIGPGLELVGPTQNFSIYSGFSKAVLTFDMIAGRLEIFPILLLFYKDTWKRF